MYNEKVIEHFRSPHHAGRLADPSAIGKVGNMACGDMMWLYIKVEKDPQGREVISDISWETFGCTAAIATSSMLSDLAKGKALDEALAITSQDVASELGSLPPVKMHCSVLAADALSEAIYSYLKEAGREIPPALEARHARLARALHSVQERLEAVPAPDVREGGGGRSGDAQTEV